MKRHGSAYDGEIELAPVARSGPALTARRADGAMLFQNRFAYAPADLPSASAALATQKQQEQMMLRLSNQFHSAGLLNLSEQSEIPAGYTYLAQFAVHDMVMSTPLLDLGGGLTPPKNKETPSLELRSLYGGGPELASNLYESPATAGKMGRLRIGHLNKARPPGFANGAAADVPRDRHEDSAIGSAPTEPAVADIRNADTLILAQLTALFIRFHNILFDISNNAGDPDPFRRARKTAAAAYRNILWNDLVARLADSRIFAHYTPSLTLPRDPDWNLPNESAFAAMRFGHTMVRAQYQLNDIFHGIGGAARTTRLLQFLNRESSANTGLALPPTDIWEIEWSRFFKTGRNRSSGFNNAAPIGPAIAAALAELPKEEPSRFPAAEGGQMSLAFRALMRGFLTGLPSGQAAARAVGANLGFGIRTLTSAEIAASLTAASNQGKCGLGSLQCLSAADISVLAERTPLFLYILLEAQIIGRGSKLGPVGSDFVCHTFAGSLRLPEDDPDRNISMISGIGLPGTMPELLKFLERHSTPGV